jgi:hypothetical protein
MGTLTFQYIAAVIVIGNQITNNYVIKMNQQTSTWAFFENFLTWVFGVIMLVAAIPHLSNPYYFLGSIYAYKLVTPSVGQLVAMILPMLQLIVAISLLAKIYDETSVFIAMILFAIFFVAQSFAYFGGLDISCGCFGPNHSNTVSIYSLSFVGFMLILSIICFTLRIIKIFGSQRSSHQTSARLQGWREVSR